MENKQHRPKRDPSKRDKTSKQMKSVTGLCTILLILLFKPQDLKERIYL